MIKFKLVFILTILFSSNVYSHDLEEWESKSPAEQRQEQNKLLREHLEPELILLLDQEGIEPVDYQSLSYYVLDDGSYSLENPNIKISKIDQIKKNFFDIFKDARLYYNIHYQNTNVCINKNLTDCSTRPFRRSSGDFYIRNLENNNNNNYIFEIEVDRNFFYVDSEEFISNFDLYDFYETPQRFDSDTQNQISLFFNSLNNDTFLVNSGIIRFCETQNMNHNILSTTRCPSNSNSAERHEKIRVIRTQDNNIIINLENQRLLARKDDFLLFIKMKMIFRETF